MSKLEQLLTQIAQSKMGIETLETRKSDGLDFHDVAVWCLRDALEAAFNAGVEQGRIGGGRREFGLRAAGADDQQRGFEHAQAQQRLEPGPAGVVIGARRGQGDQAADHDDGHRRDQHVLRNRGKRVPRGSELRR